MVYTTMGASLKTDYNYYHSHSTEIWTDRMWRAQNNKSHESCNATIIMNCHKKNRQSIMTWNGKATTMWVCSGRKAQTMLTTFNEKELRGLLKCR